LDGERLFFFRGQDRNLVGAADVRVDGPRRHESEVFGHVPIPEFVTLENILAVRSGFCQHFRRGFGACTATKVHQTLGEVRGFDKPDAVKIKIVCSDYFHRQD
jgi:hypothetical protein